MTTKRALAALALPATLASLVASAAAAQGPIAYDVVYVRQARYGDATNTTWPEVFHPARSTPAPT